MCCKKGKIVTRAHTESLHLITRDETYINTEMRINSEAASHIMCCEISTAHVLSSAIPSVYFCLLPSIQRVVECRACQRRGSGGVVCTSHKLLYHPIEASPPPKPLQPLNALHVQGDLWKQEASVLTEPASTTQTQLHISQFKCVCLHMEWACLLYQNLSQNQVLLN